MISVCIASYGDPKWAALAMERAHPSAVDQDCEVSVVHHHTGDVATSRNAAAEFATGDWLCFLDADDELGGGYISAMERAIRQTHNQRMLLLPRVAYVVKGRMRPPKFWKPTKFETGNWLVIGTLVERELFMQVGGFRPFHHGLEDWAFWSMCVQAGAKVKKVPAAIYIAHWNDDSAHRTLRRDKPRFWKEYERTRKAVWG